MAVALDEPVAVVAVLKGEQVHLLRRLPAWATAHSVLVRPAVWAFAEETTYLGYALPRLEARTGRTSPCVGVVALAWALQHLALPFLADRRYLAARVLSALPVTAATTAQYVVTGASWSCSARRSSRRSSSTWWWPTRPNASTA